MSEATVHIKRYQATTKALSFTFKEEDSNGIPQLRDLSDVSSIVLSLKKGAGTLKITGTISAPTSGVAEFAITSTTFDVVETYSYDVKAFFTDSTNDVLVSGKLEVLEAVNTSQSA